MKNILRFNIGFIRFLGKAILFIAKTIEILSAALKFMVFAGLFTTFFFGCFLGVMELFVPLAYIDIPLWVNIVAVVTTVGSIWLASDKLRDETREFNKNMNKSRSQTWFDD